MCDRVTTGYCAFAGLVDLEQWQPGNTLQHAGTLVLQHLASTAMEPRTAGPPASHVHFAPACTVLTWTVCCVQMVVLRMQHEMINNTRLSDEYMNKGKGDGSQLVGFG